jgi:hypothetical protein
VPFFASGPLEDVNDPEKKDLLAIYSGTIDSSCYRVLKYNVSSGVHLRSVLGIGKTKICPVFFADLFFFGNYSLCQWWDSDPKYNLLVCATDLPFGCGTK